MVSDGQFVILLSSIHHMHHHALYLEQFSKFLQLYPKSFYSGCFKNAAICSLQKSNFLWPFPVTWYLELSNSISSGNNCATSMFYMSFESPLLGEKMVCVEFSTCLCVGCYKGRSAQKKTVFLKAVFELALFLVHKSSKESVHTI